jgi:hypothetical protein
MNKYTAQMSGLYTLLFLCIGITLFSGCNSIDLPKGKSKGYSSYAIYKHSPDRMPDFTNKEDRTNELIKTTLKQEFSKHGLEESESTKDAELVVAFLLVVQDLATSTAIRDYYVNSGGEILSKAHKLNRKKTKEYYTDRYIKGSLIVDIVDRENNELIYRDYVTRNVFDSQSEEERKQAIVEAVAEVTAKFFRK